MKLSEYLQAHGIDQGEFAKVIDVTQASVSRYVSGKRTPRALVMRRIIAATEGVVQANDFFPEASDGRCPMGGEQ